MTAMIPFDFEGTAVRIVMQDDAPWFVAHDVSTILGYASAKDMVRNLDEDEADRHILPVSSATSEQRREMTIISESGLYNAVFKSRRPEARAFRRWVTGIVLPQIRRTGAFALPGAPLAPAPQQDDGAALQAKVAVIREARRLFGHRSARAVWHQLGLPVALADSPVSPDGDPLAAPLAAWLDGRQSCTAREAALGIGLDETDRATIWRLGQLLRAMGWLQRKERVDRWTTANVWRLPSCLTPCSPPAGRATTPPMGPISGGQGQ